MRMARGWLPILAFSGALFAQSTPTERHAPIFGTYSSLIYDAKETGDIGGTELTVIPQYITAYVLFQCAEGDAYPPVFVPAKVTANTVDFTIPDALNDMCPRLYHGVPTSKGLRLTHNGGVELVPRRKSYWAR
jgi:hypothetical protein